MEVGLEHFPSCYSLLRMIFSFINFLLGVMRIIPTSNPLYYMNTYPIIFELQPCCLDLQGTFVIPVGNYLSSWVVKKKGPVFQAVTTPFNLIFTLIGSEFLLNDGISLGR